MISEISPARFRFSFADADAATEMFKDSTTPLTVRPVSGSHFDVASDNICFTDVTSYRSQTYSGTLASFSDDTKYFITSVQRRSDPSDTMLINRSAECVTDFRGAQDTHQIMPEIMETGFSVTEARLRQVIERQLGDVCSKNITFDRRDVGPAVALTCEAICDALHAGIVDGGPLIDNPLAIAGLQEALFNTILRGVRSNYSAALMRGSTELPRVLRRAVDFMHANASRPISTTDVAVAAGMSIRSLQLSFAQWMETTPQLYLRRIRLHAARDALLFNPTTDVGFVARSLGFKSSGEFARLFRAEFGVFPTKLRR